MLVQVDLSGGANGWRLEITILINCLSVFACGCLCVLSVTAFGREYALAIHPVGQSVNAASEIQQFHQGTLPFSVRGLNGLMKRCADLILADEAVRLSPALQRNVAAACSAMAAGILHRNPNFARAHAVGLLATGASMSPQAYHLAQMAAPYEPWPLTIRLFAAERATITEKSLLLIPLFTVDVERLLETDWGRRFLAKLYQRDQGLRPLIGQIAATRTSAEQSSFLNHIKQASGTNG